jgi:hypothetical protein
MGSFERPLAKAAALTAAAVTGCLLSAGTAHAGGHLADRGGDGGAISIGGQAVGHHSDNDTRTRARNSGSGASAVNSTPDDGNATQHVDQSRTDDSRHTRIENHAERDSHDSRNSHNRLRQRDSHNDTRHRYR